MPPNTRLRPKSMALIVLHHLTKTTRLCLGTAASRCRGGRWPRDFSILVLNQAHLGEIRIRAPASAPPQRGESFPPSPASTSDNSDFFFLASISIKYGYGASIQVLFEWILALYGLVSKECYARDVKVWSER